MENLKQVLERAHNDQTAFRDIYEYTLDRVFGYVLLRVRNREEAKEVTQEIYLSLFKSLPRFRYGSDEEFYGFLWKVVRRQIIKSRRKKVVTIPLDEVYDIPSDEEAGEDYRHLLKMVGELKEKSRMVIELRYFGNHSFQEISEMMSISETNAKVIHHRALKKLEQYLKDYVEN